MQCYIALSILTYTQKFMLHCSYIRSESRDTYNGMIIVLIFILYEVLIFMHFCYEYGNSYFIPDIRVHTCTATVLWFYVILWHNLPSASAYVFFCAHKGHITELFFSQNIVKLRAIACFFFFFDNWLFLVSVVRNLTSAGAFTIRR